MLGAEALVVRIGVDDLDEGYFAQQALRIVRGQVPYRDFASLYAPGQAYVHAWLFALLHGPSLVGMRAITLLGRAGIAYLLFALTRPLVRRPLWAALPALFTLVALDDAPLRWEPHPGWLSTLLGVTAVWCLARPMPGPGWRLAAGAAAGLTCVFKQNTGALVLAALLVHPLIEHAMGIPSTASASISRRLAPTLGGFAASVVVWLAPLLVALGGDVSHLGVLVGQVPGAGLWSPPEPMIVTPLICAVGGVWLLRQPARQNDADRLPLAWLLVSGIALFVTQFPRMDDLHLVWSMPLLAVVGTIALDRLQPRLALILLAYALSLAWPAITERSAFLLEPRAALDGVSAPVETTAAIVDVTRAIDAGTAPGEPIFVYPSSPLLYVLADRPNPTRFDHLNPGALSPDDVDSVIRDLETAQPRLVVISDFWSNYWGPPAQNAPIDAWIAEHYPTMVGDFGPYTLLTPAYNAG